MYVAQVFRAALRENAFVHSLPFFLIVIYIAIRKFIFSLSAVSDVNFSSWLVVMS